SVSRPSICFRTRSTLRLSCALSGGGKDLYASRLEDARLPEVRKSKYVGMSDPIQSEAPSRPPVDGPVRPHSFRHAGALIGRGIAHIERALTRQNTARNAMLLSLLALPPISFLYLALRPNPRQLWAQRWPILVFSGLYQMALDRCVEIIGLEYLPETGPV